MSDFSDYIQKIARTDEIMAKIRAAITNPDKPGLKAGLGVASIAPIQQCDTSYQLPANSSFAFIDIIDNGEGPTTSDPCTTLNTITGLVDFNTSQATLSFGAEVDLILEMDGVFK